MNPGGYRIAMVAPGPFPAPRGSQVLVRELAEALAAAGHTVHVVAYGAGDPWNPGKGLYVHRTPALLGGGGAYGPHGWRVVLDAMLLWTLYRVVRRERIDVIHAHNYEAPILAYVVRALTGVPVVYHGHNVMSDELGRYFRYRGGRWLALRLGRFLDRTIPRRADHVVALTRRMAEFLSAQGVSDRRLTVIPPGVQAHHCDDAGRATDGFPGHRVVLYAGNLDPYQDLDILIEAMRDVVRWDPRALLVVATHGSGTCVVEQAQRFDVAEQVRVVVTPDFESVRDLLHRADVVVCPRRSWSGFPIKILNYMAAGRAIVATRGAATGLSGGPLVVADPDPGSFARAITATLRDPCQRARLGADARKLAEEVFVWPRLVPAVVDVYRAVVGAEDRIEPDLQECKKVLQKTTVWEFMKGWRAVERTGARAGLN